MTLWFGIGETSKVALIYMGTLMPVLVNTYTGVSLTPQINVDVARVFGASQMQLVRDIVMPSALSAILAGIKDSPRDRMDRRPGSRNDFSKYRPWLYDYPRLQRR